MVPRSWVFVTGIVVAGVLSASLPMLAEAQNFGPLAGSDSFGQGVATDEFAQGVATEEFANEQYDDLSQGTVGIQPYQSVATRGRELSPELNVLVELIELPRDLLTIDILGRDRNEQTGAVLLNRR